MMLRGIIVLSLILVTFSGLRAQDSTGSYLLRKIIIEGNKITRNYVILRELPFAEGDTVNQSELKYGRERLYSTGLFTRVSFQPEPVGKRDMDLLIYVEEAWYIWPYPVVGFQDRDWRHLYFGAGIQDQNFQGREERLAGSFALGYDPFASVSFSDPYFGPGRNYTFSAEGSYSYGQNFGVQTGSASGQFRDSFGNLKLEVGRRFGYYSTLTLGAAFNYVAKDADTTNLVLSPTGTDMFPSLNVSYTYDSRNLKVFATRGAYVYLALAKYGVGESLVNFGRLSLDASGFLSPSSMLTIAARVHANLSEGPRIPPYNHVFLGYNERIRGMFNTVSEGESIVGANLELRIPIIKQMYFDIPDVPFRQYLSNRIGLYWAFFVDAGETMSKRLNFNNNAALYGYGGGLCFLLPYDSVVQFDYARGNDRLWEFILDFGVTI